MIYSINTFDFNELDPLVYLPRTIPFSRLCLIQSVRLQCNIWCDYNGIIPYQLNGLSESEWPPAPHQIGTWIEACKSLAQMTGLRHLRIKLDSATGPCICGRTDCPHTNEKNQVLRPLCDVRASDIFEVSVYWCWDHVQRLGVPFDIKYEERWDSMPTS